MRQPCRGSMSAMSYVEIRRILRSTISATAVNSILSLRWKITGGATCIVERRQKIWQESLGVR